MHLTNVLLELASIVSCRFIECCGCKYRPLDKYKRVSAISGGYTWEVLCHYFFVVGGVVLGAILTLYPDVYRGVRVSGWWISGSLIFVATFLAWRQQYL